MEDATVVQSAPSGAYQRLGRKTLSIFILERINASFIFLLISLVLFAIDGQEFVAKTTISHLPYYIGLVAWISLAAFAVLLAVAVLVAWLTYVNYRFSLGDDSLKIKRGVIDKEEIAIPYRQIQDVDIDRSPGFQMMGLSRIVILTAGHEEKGDKPDESEGILPALDKDLAEWLQNELLKRANVQKVVEAK